MSIEIENKYLLLDGIPSQFFQETPGTRPTHGLYNRYSRIEMRQYYTRLDDRSETRYRLANNQTAFRGIKTVGGQTRYAKEESISIAAFHKEKALSGTQALEKVRYNVFIPSGKKIELDVYGGLLSGLVTAEVEFDNQEEAAAFTPPEWFGDYRNVTNENQYKNSWLARTHPANLFASVQNKSLHA